MISDNKRYFCVIFLQKYALLRVQKHKISKEISNVAMQYLSPILPIFNVSSKSLLKRTFGA